MNIRVRPARVIGLSIFLSVAGCTAQAAEGTASAGCVEFKSNEKKLKELAKMARKGFVTGDVVVVNRCTTNIAVVVHTRDQFQQTGDMPAALENQCATQEVEPNRSLVLRSQSREKREGLAPFVPKYPPVICQGAAKGGEACACAAGVVQVPMPDVSALR